MLRPITPGIWQIDLPWTNAWLLAGNREAVLIDTGTRWDRKAVLAALDAALPGEFRLTSILLTHAHCDHAGNAAFLADRFGANVHCHAAESPFLATRRTYVPSGIRAISASGLLFAGGEVVFPVRRCKPHTLLKEADSVQTPIGELKVIETPGHTPGHVSYYDEANGWLFSGDALINIIPWVRRVGLSLPVRVFTSNPQEAAQSAWKIAGLATSSLFPGHGPPLTEHASRQIRSFMEKAAPRPPNA